MVTPKYRSLLAALLLAGCSRAPKTDQPSNLRFESESELNWSAPFSLAANLDGSRLLVMAATPAGAMILRQSQDGGVTFSSAQELPCPLRQGFHDKDSIHLLHTAERAVLLDEDDSDTLRSATSSDGETWEQGGSLTIKPMPRVVTFDEMDAGNTTVAAIGPSVSLTYPLYLSANDGSDWEARQVTLPIPDGLKNITIDPPGAFGTPQVSVDSRDRIHWLVPEYRFSDAKGQKQTGSLYLQVDGQGQTSNGQLFPAEYRSQHAVLGENRQLPDHLYRLTANEANSTEKSRINIAYTLEFAQSQDGGVHWSAPCVLDDHKGIKQHLQVAGDGPLLVAAWGDSRSSQPGLYCCTSIDGGKSWSEAERVGETPDYRWQLLVCKGKVLLAGSLDNPRSYRKTPFAIHGEVK